MVLTEYGAPFHILSPSQSVGHFSLSKVKLLTSTVKEKYILTSIIPNIPNKYTIKTYYMVDLTELNLCRTC
jgi:hypothetical protein